MTRCNPIEFRKWCGTAGTAAGKGFRGSIHRPMIVLLGVVEEPYFSYYNWLYLCIIYIYIYIYMYIYIYTQIWSIYIYIHVEVRTSSNNPPPAVIWVWTLGIFQPPDILLYIIYDDYWFVSHSWLIIIDEHWRSSIIVDCHHVSKLFFFNVIHWLRPILMTHIWWFPES